MPFCSYAMLGDAAEDKSICQVTKYLSVLHFCLAAQNTARFGSVFYETAPDKASKSSNFLKFFLCFTEAESEIFRHNSLASVNYVLGSYGILYIKQTTPKPPQKPNTKRQL